MNEEELKIYNRGIKEGSKHKNSSEQTIKMYEKKDTLKNHQLKITIGTSVAVILFIIGATNYFVTRFNELENDNKEVKQMVQTIEDQGTRNKEHIVELENRAVIADLDRVKILTKLENIEVAIFELKQSLKDHDLN